MGRKKSIVELAEDQRLKESLIKLWEEHPALYNKSHPDFMKPAVKQAIYSKLAEEVKCTAEDVKIKLRSLRDSYVKERRIRELESISGSGASKRTPFIYYERLHFMHAHVRIRRSVSSIQDDPDGENEESENDRESQSQPNAEDTQADSIGLGDDINLDDSFDVNGIEIEVLDANVNVTPSNRKSPRISNRKDSPAVRNATDSGTPSIKYKRARMEKKRSAKESNESPTTGKNAKKIKSQDLGETLPVLSPLQLIGAQHSKRIKQKSESELNAHLGSLVGVLKQSVTSPPSDKSALTPEELLGRAVTAAVAGVKNKRKKAQLMIEFRQIIGQCELAQADEDDD